MKLSVVVITLNEEKNIKRCLESTKNIGDEFLVLDSLSTDDTVKIATDFGAKVIAQPFLGYVEQRNKGDELATHDWILMLDADEVISPELEKSILSIKEHTAHSVYELNRMTNYCGKWIKHCGWYPDKKIRLYNRNAGKWIGHLVHEHWQANNKSETTGSLKGDLLHYSFYSIAEHISQINKFTDLSARANAQNGKNYSILELWLGPKVFFLNSFLFKLGFLDGYYGYIVCKLSSYAQLIKYSKTRQYNKLKKEGKTY